jgi:hypothetical protein
MALMAIVVAGAATTAHAEGGDVASGHCLMLFPIELTHNL